ncbi:MAG: mechanosensitive ion channel [Deltaproteobacteria bacterium]|nr:mechanosensitive ion channel [Deltaproteobacteria bacterium]
MDFDRILEVITTWATTYGLQVVGAILILVVGKIAANVIRRSIRRLLAARKVDRSIVSFASSLAYFTILAVAVLAALSKFGIQTTSFIAVLGAAGFAVGLALQGSLGNFAAGVLILVLRPFNVDDYIKGGGVEGTVKEIHLFVTELATLDNIKVLVPNSALFGGNIEVLTGYDTRRVVVPIGIAYGENIGQARDAAIAVMNGHDLTLDDPAPNVVVTGWGDSSVDMSALCWCEPANYWEVFFDLNRLIKEAFDDKDIEIPFPQRVVHTAKAA